MMWQSLMNLANDFSSVTFIGTAILVFIEDHTGRKSGGGTSAAYV
jgi:hypothetical protein